MYGAFVSRSPEELARGTSRAAPFSRGAAVLGLLCLLPQASAGQMTPTPPPTAAGACTIVGPLLGPSDFGVAAGLPVADASAARLADGRVRLHVFAQGLGIVSAVSLAADGASFVPEAGARLPDGAGMPRVVVNPAGGSSTSARAASGRP